MSNAIIKRIWKGTPPACIGRAMLRFVRGSLHFTRRFSEKEWVMDDGKRFSAFRHLASRDRKERTGDETVFIVRFRFKRHSYNFNRRASRIPIPLIAGTPGFQEKLWVVDRKDGTWQGMYQFETYQAVKDYRQSLVFRVMNRRALSDSLEYTILPGAILSEYLQSRSVL